MNDTELKYLVPASVISIIIITIAVSQSLPYYLAVDPFNGQVTLMVFALLGIGGIVIGTGILSILFAQIEIYFKANFLQEQTKDA